VETPRACGRGRVHLLSLACRGLCRDIEIAWPLVRAIRVSGLQSGATIDHVTRCRRREREDARQLGAPKGPTPRSKPQEESLQIPSAGWRDRDLRSSLPLGVSSLCAHAFGLGSGGA
jgi:hypothetical protein